jgi:ribA/ribD-fused uncharacterized protein
MRTPEAVSSTRYPQGSAEFVYDEIPYISLAQHFYHQKALFVGDFQTAEKIMNAKDEDAVKTRARQIRNSGNDKAWIGISSKVLVQGLKAKFLQELSLCNWLLNQDEAAIKSISSLWGLTQSDITRDWIGNSADRGNPLGDALAEVRTRLLVT